MTSDVMRKKASTTQTKRSKQHFVVFFRCPGERRSKAQFITKEEVFEYRRSSPEFKVTGILPITDVSLRDKFWFCEIKESENSFQQAILSTAKAASMLSKGRELGVITGPHSTISKANDSADACWESPGSD